MKSIEYLYPYRFTIFFISLLFILFGELLIPFDTFNTYITPIFFIVNVLAGTLLISKKKEITQDLYQSVFSNYFLHTVFFISGY